MRRKSGPRYGGLRKNLRPQVDRGTPEVQARRVGLAGDGSEVLAHYPLGVALARGVITTEERDAGLRYAWAYRAATGRPVAVPAGAATAAAGPGGRNRAATAARDAAQPAPAGNSFSRPPESLA